MPTFTYTALDSAGKPTSGALPAASRVAASETLTRQGLTPVAVEEQSSAAAAPKAHASVGGRIPQAAAEAFIRELSNLLAGGVALSRALHILAREASQPAAKKQWQIIHDEVVGGTSLAEAMGHWPRTFSPVQVAMVRAGETGGFLDVVLAQIADFRTRERDLKAKVKGAMIYPSVLAVLATGVLIFLLTYFIPKFSALFDTFDHKNAAAAKVPKGDFYVSPNLPALTRGIIISSYVVTRYGLVLAIVAVVAGVLIHRALKAPSGRRVYERVLLKSPGLGGVLSRFAQVRFCRMLGTLLESGVPLIASLKVAREAIGNQILSDAVSGSIEDVQRGASLARSLGTCTLLFPPSVVEVIAVAEESARLDHELLRLAATNESELDRKLRMLVALAEPGMLFVMAALIGTIVIGMLLPMLTLSDYINP
ncbi:MAG: type II secretion system F family protein [Planctomycetaceae bacterium]|nr:type II secretion system F family protein [Planctomycetaceae bacterium]